MTVAEDAQYQPLATKEKTNNEKLEIPESFGFGVRHVQSLIIFVSLAVAFIARGHLGISVVAMTNLETHKRPVEDFNSAKDIVSNNSVITNITDLKENIEMYARINLSIKHRNLTNALPDGFTVYKTYDWPKSIQEMVLGSFFLGYCIMMFPIGIVCQRYGGKLPIQIALLVNAIVSILTPHLAAWGGWKAVCACRVLQGLSQAGMYPGLQTLISKWVPRQERGRLCAYIYTGSGLGTVIAFQIGGVLASTSWGWPSIFWCTGLLCLIMFVIMTLFGAASPSDHKTISIEEKTFIMGRADDGVKRGRHVPWKAIAQSKPVWATVITHIGSGVSYVFFFTQVPSYIHYILGVDVTKSGLLSSLPYIGAIFSSILFGYLSDFCTNRNIMSIKNARRCSNSLSQIGVASCMLLVSFTKNVELAVTCLVSSLSLQSGVHTGWMVNQVDLASNYTGTLMSIGNTLTNVVYVALTATVSVIVTDVTNQYQWRIIFIVVASLTFITNGLFVVMMSSESQPWNDYDHEDGKEKPDIEKKLSLK
ncbi:hypothetical protein ACJJTC_005335 [Scirpophaga incertulas]